MRCSANLRSGFDAVGAGSFSQSCLAGSSPAHGFGYRSVYDIRDLLTAPGHESVGVMLDDLAEGEDDAWCVGQRQQVLSYLADEGFQSPTVGDWPAWHVAPIVSIRLLIVLNSRVGSADGSSPATFLPITSRVEASAAHAKLSAISLCGGKKRLRNGRG